MLGLRDYARIHFEYKAPTWQELEMIERKFQTTKTRAQIHLNTLTQRLGPMGMSMRPESKGRPEGFGPQAPPPRGAWWNRLVVRGAPANSVLNPFVAVTARATCGNRTARISSFEEQTGTQPFTAKQHG